MLNEKIVLDFKNSLLTGKEFDVLSDDEYCWSLKSDKCIIRFMFEKYDEGYTIEFVEPDADNSCKPMHMLLLRHMRGAYDAGRESDNPSYYAWLVEKYFSDLLSGDFSIRKEYEELEKNFFDKLSDAYCLPDAGIAKEKIKRFDISWMKDL